MTLRFGVLSDPLIIANELGCDMIVLWLAREGTLCAESKSPVWATKQLVDAINQMLEYDKHIRVCIEPKPNEPIDRSICGTMDHVMGVSAATIDPKRVGGNLESAHAIFAGLDPANEIGFALAFNKLFTVHLNDQNGIRYDRDKSFGVENLRAAFNQVKVLVENDYGSKGEYVGLDGKSDDQKNIYRSQIVFLESAFDFYLHELTKYGLRKMLSGDWPKTEKYKNLKIPMKHVERGLNVPSAIQWFVECVNDACGAVLIVIC